MEQQQQPQERRYREILREGVQCKLPWRNRQMPPASRRRPDRRFDRSSILLELVIGGLITSMIVWWLFF